ncbi:MAG TPA: sigma-70 family RNA polymerase sigma factor [Anaeromyxobacter sp.]|nr:sigma-70 family RNA polymerase sigma factor [Anaeromyxobacter sp.]
MREPGATPADALAHADALYHLARHLTRHAADAEDLVQETYARAFRALGRIAAGPELRAWLFRILRNAFLDLQRRARRSPVDARDDLDGLAGAAPGEEAWLRGDAELERMRGIVGAEIEAALRTLPEDSRVVVLLDVEGFSEAEVGEVMGCPVGTVKSRLARARAALRERLSEYRR